MLNDGLSRSFSTNKSDESVVPLAISVIRGSRAAFAASVR